MIRRKTNKPVAGEMSNFTQINPNASGIDIGSAEHWVCVPPDRTPQNVRKFSCFTPDLIEMASWLLECQVDTIAMESTGVYWIPPFQILEERGIESTTSIKDKLLAAMLRSIDTFVPGWGCVRVLGLPAVRSKVLIPVK